HIFLYEDTILLGAAIGNIISIFEPSVASAAGQPILLLFGLFAGMYTGCLAIALAEVLNVIPIMMRRAKMQKGSGIVLTMIALGKCVGTLAQFYFHWLP
ncbi:MAG: stage V sporulation protein AB, partial [Lachnospiraceae bacterium]